jgi:hypothetical protein
MAVVRRRSEESADKRSSTVYRTILSGLTSDLPSSVWGRPECQRVVRAAQHCMCHHYNNGFRISVLFALDRDGLFDTSLLSIPHADIDDIADVTHRQ